MSRYHLRLRDWIIILALVAAALVVTEWLAGAALERWVGIDLHF